MLQTSQQKNSKQSLKAEALKELATRELENRHQEERKDLVAFIKYYFKENNLNFQENWHHHLIAEKLVKVLNGEITRLMINIPPGHMKCLDPETVIFTPCGNKKLRDIEEGDLIYAENGKELVIEKVRAKEIEQRKKSIRVTTRSGREIVMSSDHRMLTEKGYRQVGVGNFIYCLNKEINNDYEIPEAELTFLSHMIFEGNCGEKNVRYTNADKEVVNEFLVACEALDIPIKKYTCNKPYDYNLMGGNNGKAQQLLGKYGLRGHKCYTKRLPSEFFTMSLRQKWIFIGIALTTDGCIATQAGNAVISLANEGLIDDIQLLLSTCGIVSSKSFTANEHAGAWNLTIGRSQLKKIYENCDLKHKTKKCEEVLKKEGYSMNDLYPNSFTDGLNGYKARKRGVRIDNNKDITPKRFEKLIKIFPFIASKKNKDFYWDKIVKIEDVGERDLIHIEVSGKKNFLANGFVSHNTELVTKSFPVWALGKYPKIEICATGYATNLTQTYSGEARDYYTSDTFRNVFPRTPALRPDQNTKEWWKNTEGGGYYATGTGGSITGRRFNIFIIDDPLKPDEADSDVKRVGVNNWYKNTVLSRLYNPLKDAVIIIMQRTHENDLCGYLMAEMEEGTGEKWEVVSIPAVAEIEDEYRLEGEALHVDRYPVEALNTLKKSLGNVNFSCQYQQNPIAKESQEFHEEWFKYYMNEPIEGRIMTAVDPAFSKKATADYTSIITGKFVKDVLYILEISHGRFNPEELEDKIVYHARKWGSEKVGVEAVAAQSIIGFSLKNRFRKEGIRSNVVDIRQKGTKEQKIRRLVPLYRNGQIYHKASTCDDLEKQLVKFPRGTHDDIVDSEQMLFDMYELKSDTKRKKTFVQPKRYNPLTGKSY